MESDIKNIEGHNMFDRQLAPVPEATQVRIVTLMPDFYEFWDKAKNETLENKIALWDNLFESKHRSFYDAVIYEGFTGDRLAQMKMAKLKGFFSRLTDADVKRMKSREAEIMKLIPIALEPFKEILPEEKLSTDHYILPSLYTSSGAVRPYNRNLVIFYGLELLSTFKNPQDIKANVFHETVHVIHFRELYPLLADKLKGSIFDTESMRYMGPLFFSYMEGIAVYLTEKAYPNQWRIGLIESNVPKYEENFASYTRMLLDDAQDFEFQKYQKYFFDDSKDPVVPQKFGYWLGYKAIQHLAKTFTVKEMLSWPPDHIKEMMTKVVAELTSRK